MKNDQTKTSTKPLTKKKQFACKLKKRPPSNHVTHPAIVGTLQWLKARTEAVIADPTIPWNGVWQDYDWMKEGKHLEPSPGQFITPDNPESFEPGLFNRLDAQAKPGGFYLINLEDKIDLVDSGAWADIDIILKATPTKELYAKQTLENIQSSLDEFAREQDRMVQRKQELARSA